MVSLNNFFVRLISIFIWIRISPPPGWIINKADGYDRYFRKKYGPPPYDQIKYFKGNKFKYKVYYKTVAQGRIEEVFYAKRRILV